MPYTPLGCFDRNAMIALGHPLGAPHTYIIEMTGHRLVKIGKAANVWKRLAQLQVGNPFKLELVEWLLGDVEVDLHTRLVDHRVRGEWFRYTPVVDAFIASCAAVPTIFGKRWSQMPRSVA